ncbi:MAG: outer membrane lipoprotein carrier protein LolA [Acidobacteriia bacterium]|nr:outer membrane lipoprotein carrier protein LolA [Terriglobia bacterium]
MKLLLALLCLITMAEAQADLGRLLRGIENRYNSPRTMQMLFEQSLTGTGRIARVESGVLYLRKPGRMRWEYHSPEGKLFLSDGKNVYFYSPATRRAERSKLKQSDDMRAPIAFLMGKLDFQRDFREYRTWPDGADTHLVATPRSDKAPYTSVEFVVQPSYQISVLKVIGHDRSVMQFKLSHELINPPIEDKLFQFSLPAGAEMVDVNGQEGRQ